ncbi:MAG: LysE family translocator [Pseudomonadota bacterium]
MPDTAVVLTFFLLWLAIVPTPGANSLLIVHLALVDSPVRILGAIFGNMFGLVLLGAAALFGWNAALEALPALKPAIRICGAVYLIWFGIMLWRSVGTAPPISISSEQKNDAQPRVQPTPGTVASAVGLGFTTQLSNAQAIVFITSLFAVSGVFRADLVTGMTCVVVMVVTNVLYLATLAGVLQLGPARRWYQRRQAMMKRIIGGLFVLIGGRLLWAALPALRSSE